MTASEYFAFIKIRAISKSVTPEVVKEAMLFEMERDHDEDESICEATDFDDDFDEIDEEEFEVISTIRSMSQWVDQSVDFIDKLPVGSIFKGITKDSIMKDYLIVMKDDEGHSLWIPLFESYDVVCVLKKLNSREKKWEIIQTGTLDEITNYIDTTAKDGDVFKTININGEPFDLFDDFEAYEEDPAEVKNHLGVYLSIMHEDHEPEFMHMAAVKHNSLINAMVKEYIERGDLG